MSAAIRGVQRLTENSDFPVAPDWHAGHAVGKMKYGGA